MAWHAEIRREAMEIHPRLYLYNRGPDAVEILLEDGTWYRHTAEGVRIPDDVARPGLPLPQPSIEAISTALVDYAPAQVARLEGEIKVLREALKVERTRVELMIDKALEDH